MSKDFAQSITMRGKIISRLEERRKTKKRNFSEPFPILSKSYATLNHNIYNPPKFDLLKVRSDLFNSNPNVSNSDSFKKKVLIKKERGPFELCKSIIPEKLNFSGKRIKTELERKEEKRKKSILEVEKFFLYFDKEKVQKKKNFLRKSIITDVYLQYFERKNQNSLCNLQEFSSILNSRKAEENKIKIKKLKEKEEKELELQNLINEFKQEKKAWDKIDRNLEIQLKDKKLMQSPKKLPLNFLKLPISINNKII
jgi:hypothetical protein